ncbi:hypothetical protein UPYG_G00126250 [Umbra pygmaea]|uniref:Uncharacterized protein n=1 Tax=Umbra pygmaea TaxID=75934 RepID=A0ABD0X6C4_UMBPY
MLPPPGHQQDAEWDVLFLLESAAREGWWGLTEKPGAPDVDVASDYSDTGTSSSPRPQGKRSRKTLDVFANDDSTVLMRTLTKTLETVASKRMDDEVTKF